MENQQGYDHNMPINGSLTRNQREIFERIRDLELTITELRGDIKTMRILGVAFVILIEISLPIMWHFSNSGGI